MDMFPVFCGLLSFVLIGPSDTKVVTLKLTSIIEGERKNFYGTCNCPCGQVNVTVLSGNPQLFLAKNSIPSLQWGKWGKRVVGCKNCLKEVTLVNFTNSSSFGLSVLTTKLSDIVKVEAANLEDIEERIFPSQELMIGTSKVGVRKNFEVTCNGQCRHLNVRAISGRPWLYFSKSIPIFERQNCQNCLEDVNQVNSRTFGFTVPTASSGDIVMVEAANLKDITEVPYPSKIFDVDMEPWEHKTVNFTCHGPCKELRVYVESTGGIPVWYVSKYIPRFGTYDCYNCICGKYYQTVDNTCNFRSLDDISSFVVLLEAFYHRLFAKLIIEALNLNV